MKVRAVFNGIFLTILLLAPAAVLSETGESEHGTEQETGTVIVTIEGLRNCEGRLRVELWASEDGFPRDQEKALLRVVSIIDGESVQFIFDDLPFGEYAVSALHDEDENGKMNMNLFGPAEGYCISNGVRGGILSGAPGFDDASFALEGEEMILSIEMGY